MVHECIKMLTKLLATLILFSVIIALSSCDNNDDDMSPGIEGNISLASNSSLGDYLVDGNGMTLYFFSRDAGGQSNCVDASCLNNWPVYYSDNINPGSGLDPADFGTITRSDGEMQTTYKGWPLYYYAGDASEGDVNGDAVGNVWFVAKPDYSIMIAMNQLVGHDGNNYTDVA